MLKQVQGVPKSATFGKFNCLIAQVTGIGHSIVLGWRWMNVADGGDTEGGCIRVCCNIVRIRKRGS
jgi:hypothetical protein